MRKIVHKFLQALALLAGVWLLSLLLLLLAPGDPASRYWGPGVEQSVLERMRAQAGRDAPIPQQMLFWSKRLLHADLGYSWRHHLPASRVIATALPATLQLGFCALIINFILGSFFGIVAAARAQHPTGVLLDFGSLGLYATPTFLLAMLAIWVFSVQFNWLPNTGMQSLYLSEPSTFAILRDRIRHVLLPATILGTVGAVSTMRYVRAQMLNFFEQPCFLLAMAKGLPEWRVLVQHGFRNALLPVVTQFGLAVPLLLSGAFVIEVIFAWPGMGRITYEAIFAKDYPVVLAANLLTAAMVIAGNLLADLLYPLVDPRVVQ